MREAVVNALAHRDLGPLARSTPVQVNLFPDRLVITNPGGLFGPVTLDRLGEPGILAARNASLMRILEDLPGPNGLGPVCENRGSGIAAMLESLRRAGLRPPIFEDRIASFTVTFLAESLLDSDTLRWLDDLGIEGLSGSQRAVLAMLHRGDDVTHASFQSVTGLQSQSAKRELDDLVRRGLLEELGEGSLASYRLAVHDRRDRRAEILRLLRLKGPLSRAEIETALGLEPANAAWWIRSLKSERLIEPTHPGRSPKVKYRLRRARRR
jgi:ATP-dependent DNA helicase RecG